MKSSLPRSTQTAWLSALAGFAVLTLTASRLPAADVTWTGSSVANDNWTTPANWGGIAPVANDRLYFDGSTRLTPNNDFAAGTIFGSLAFNNGASSFTLGGNSLVLTNGSDAGAGTTVGGGITNASFFDQTISLPITLSAGKHNIEADFATLNLNGTVTRNTGATVVLLPFAGINLTGSGLANINGILGGWAIHVNGTDWAALDGSGNVVAYAGYTDIGAGAIASDPTSNVRYSGDTANLTAASGVAINSLLVLEGAARFLTNATGGTLRLGSKGGIYRSGASVGAFTVTGGMLTANGGGELSFICGPIATASGNNLQISSIVTNDGPANVVSVNTMGYLSLNAANTYSGGTYINQGRIQTGNAAAFGTGPVYVYPGGHAFLSTSGTYANNFFVSGVGSTEVSGGATGPGAIRLGNNTVSGKITLLGNARIGTGNSSGRVTGQITGNGTLEVAAFTGGLNMTFANTGTANDWAGGFLINSLATSRAIYFKLGANEQIPDGPGKGDVTINSSGDVARLELAGHTETINGLISGAGLSANLQVANFDGPTAATLILGNNNATATFAGVIQDANAVTNLSVVKIGTGTQTLGGVSTYRGATTVNGGSLVFGANAWSANTAQIAVNGNATLDASAVSPASLGVSQSLTMSNGTVKLALVPGVPTLTTTNLTALGAANYVVITSIGPVGSYPAQFPILKGTNVAGTLNFGLGAPLPPSPGAAYAGYISNNLANNSVDLVLTAGPVQLKWAGFDGFSINSSWDTTTTDWKLLNGALTTYADGNFVLFDDSASNGIVALNQTVVPPGVTVSNNNLAYIFNGSGSISGSGALFKQGLGKLTIDNSGLNNFSGGVTLSGGTLQVGNNDSAGNLPDTGLIANNGTLIYARNDSVTVNNVISGTGTLTQNSTGTLLLNGANTFTGAVTVAQGTLQVGDNSALGTTNGSTTIASGATLDLNGAAGNTRRLGSERIIAGGAGVSGLGAIVNNGADTYPAMSLVTLTGNTTFGGIGRWDLRATGTGLADPAAASLSTGGNAYNLVKVGLNEVAIANATIDPALADIDIQQGTFQINGNNTGLGNPANTLAVEPGAIFSLYDTTNLLNKKIVLADAATLENTHGANIIVGPITLTGTAAFSVLNAPLTLNGMLNGPGILSKAGALPLVINGDGSGLTNGAAVGAGTLTLNGLLGGALTNAASATLMGTGTNNGLVDMSGTLAPGASNVVGTLTAGGLILESGATVVFDLNYDNTPGKGSNDLVVVNGDLAVNGNTIVINPLSILHKGVPYTLFTYSSNLIWNAAFSVTDSSFGYTYTIDTNTPGQVNIVASGGPPIWNGGSATTSNWSEPANWGGVAIGSGSLLYFAGNNRLNNINDTTAGSSYNGLAFNTDAGAFVLGGNPIALNGNVQNYSASVETINLGLSLGASAGNSTFNGGAGSLVIGGNVTNTASLGTLMLSGNGILTNLLCSADPNSITNVLVTTSNANWTLMDTSPSTTNSIPLQLDIQAGTFNFGQGASAPILNSTANNNNSRLGVVSGAPATFNMVNGTLTIAARLNTGAGANTIATLNQTGGTLNLLSIFQCSDSYATASTTVNLTGGTLTVGTPTNGNAFYVASRGTGVVSVAGSSLVQCGTLDMSRNAAGNTLGSVGVINLNGGTLAVNRVGTATSAAQAGGTPTATFNFNGGTLKARTSSATFYQGNAASPACPITSIVKSGGAIIDSDTNSISILEPLRHDSTLGATLDGGLTKLGAGTLTLTAANTYTGPTLVNNGTLAVNGSLAAGGAVTVNSGSALSGTGTCGGNVTINSGGTLAPGPGIGTLTVWSNVFLQAGSTTFMEINRGPTAANDVLRCPNGGAIHLGGTLNVTNLGPRLQSGDTFTLFSGALSGSITPSSLPPLWPGLSWNTSSLSSSGTISVVGVMAQPLIGCVVSSNNLVLNGSGGLAGATYYVVTSTNVALPMSSWTRVATNIFDANGNFNFSIPIDPSAASGFYRIQVQ